MNRAPLVLSPRASLLVAIATLLTVGQPALAADANGFPVCTVSGDQMLPVTVPDGAGGAIIAWLDRRPGVAAAGVCFAQRVNAQGVSQWTPGGVQLSTTGDVAPPVIAADGAGGAFVAYGGDSSPPRIQRVDASGAIQWGPDGTALSSGSSSQRDLAITRDIGGAGGAIVAWREMNASGGTSDIHAQKVNSAGIVQWSSTGNVVVATNMNFEAQPALVSDGAGGAIVMWLGNGARAQRLDAAGTPQWGNVILSATANNRVPAIASDGAGGAVAAWAGGGIFAQRVSAAGNRLWSPTNGGVTLSTLGNQVTMIPDGAGGGIFTWQENRSGTNFNIFAQKLDNTGALQWLGTGVEVVVETQDQLAPTIVSDGGTGAIITWYDLRSNPTGADIFAQRLDAASTPQWATNGTPISSVADAQEFPTIATDGAGGAYIAWEDMRSGNEDIYANHVGPSGAILDVPLDGGEPTISGPWPHPFRDQVTFTLRLPGSMRLGLDVFDVNGRRVRTFGSRELPAGPHAFTWDGRADDGHEAAAGIYFLRVAGGSVSAIRPVVRLR
jgi:hypothetical protein